MSTTGSNLLAEAEAGGASNRAALLAAINDAANQLGGKKGVSIASAAKHGSNLMQGSGVNANLARDLTSNAGSRVADMNDFRDQAPTGLGSDKGKTLLNAVRARDGENRQEEDLRSMRSEYDYGSKKKFLDVLGNVSAATKLKRMREQHE